MANSSQSESGWHEKSCGAHNAMSPPRSVASFAALGASEDEDHECKPHTVRVHQREQEPG